MTFTICSYYVSSAISGRLGRLIEQAEVLKQLKTIDSSLSLISRQVLYLCNLDLSKLNPMIVQHGVIIRNSNNYKRSKGDIINVTKAVARKSTLQIIKKARVVNSFH